MASEELDLNRFNQIIDEYSSQFENAPRNTRQIVQFCKTRSYNYKYGELNPFYSIWTKQQKSTSKTTKGSRSPTPENEINWDSFWNEYETKYAYPPKKAIHLWNYAKEEKFVIVKYKLARLAFDRINRMRINEMNQNNCEGHTQTNTGHKTPNTNDSKNNVLVLKVTKYTSDSDLEFIKEKFLELLQGFRESILHDPANPLQLFNFINEDTKYKVRYGDVKKCYNYAVKHKWFKPMKRMRKVRRKRKKKKTKTAVNPSEPEGTDKDKNSEGENSDHENGEFVLEIDHETIKNEEIKLKEQEEKKEIIVHEVMADEEYDIMLVKYKVKYNNPPRNASQIMNFAKEIGEMYKYKACRIAFNRWINFRGAKMPTMTKETQPGANEEEESD